MTPILPKKNYHLQSGNINLVLGSTQPCSINNIECIYFYGLYSEDKITNVHLLVISHIHLCLMNK
jgi:hypothetical protein